MEVPERAASTGKYKTKQKSTQKNKACHNNETRERVKRQKFAKKHKPTEKQAYFMKQYYMSCLCCACCAKKGGGVVRNNLIFPLYST